MKRGDRLKKSTLVTGALCGAWLMACGVAWAAVDPVTVEVHYQNGVKYFKRGLYEKSIAEFEKTLNLDPDNAEARAYLEKVKSLVTQQKPAAPAPSNDAQVRRLYDEGRQLYQERRYKEAQDVFSEILRLKPVDDFASFYREKCEIFISRQLAKEKKKEERQKRAQQRREAIAAKRMAQEQKRLERRQMLDQRAAVKRAHQRDIGEQPKAEEAKPEEEIIEQTPAPEPAAASRQTDADAAGSGMSEREQRVIRKQEARQEKLQEKAEREARERQKKTALREAKALEREKFLDKKASIKEEKRARDDARQRIKDLFIKGVEEYSRKQYDEAIASFRGVIDAEKKSGIRYSHSALRLLHKAQARQKGIGEDRQI